jgi:hypothetical protein
MHNVHPIRNILHSIEIYLEFAHPNIGWADSSFKAVIVVFGVGIVNVGTAGLVGWRGLPDLRRLETWADLQHLGTFKELYVIEYELAHKKKRSRTYTSMNGAFDI